jgi:hypothetical protein
VDNSTWSLSERHLDVTGFARGGIYSSAALAISPRILRCSLHEMGDRHAMQHGRSCMIEHILDGGAGQRRRSELALYDIEEMLAVAQVVAT